jgi:hypothetical protein
MPANTAPIFTLTPNVGQVKITQSAALANSAGVGTVATDIFKAFTAGANGSLVQRVRFNVVATAAAVSSVATVLRIYLSTVGSGSTTAADTFLLGEVAVPAISAANASNATNYYDFPLNFAIPAGTYIHVSQHAAQTANQSWNATVIGGDY